MSDDDTVLFNWLSSGNNRRPASDELVTVDIPCGTQSVPVVISPRASYVELVAWLSANRACLDDLLHNYGAVVFRSFKNVSCEVFERAARVLTPRLQKYIDGSSPRRIISEYVYSSSEFPSVLPITLHSELSYSHCWPSRVYFFCVEPAPIGGETILADTRRIASSLSPLLRKKFAEKGVRYVRNLHSGRGLGLSWMSAFGTFDRRVVEAHCCNAGIQFEWMGSDNLRTVQVRDAFAKHYSTGELVWFNQVDQWHPSNLGTDTQSLLLNTVGQEQLPLNSSYGDGSPLDDWVLKEIRKIYQAEAITLHLEKDDLLIVDNMLIAHGRMPFSGPRTLLVSLGGCIYANDVRVDRESARDGC
jgi:Taurine catabolism dioxygenase TauD, TfdA family